MKRLYKIIVPLLLLIVGLVVLGRVISNFTAAPELGVNGGKLASCPETLNCVSSQVDPNDPHFVSPLNPAQPKRITAEPIAELVDQIEKMTGCRLVERTNTYARFEFRSLIFGFVDDLEIQTITGSPKIDIRSSSRLGYSDLGANRRRVEAIRKRFSK